MVTRHDQSVQRRAVYFGSRSSFAWFSCSHGGATLESSAREIGCVLRRHRAGRAGTRILRVRWRRVLAVRSTTR